MSPAPPTPAARPLDPACAPARPPRSPCTPCSPPCPARGAGDSLQARPILFLSPSSLGLHLGFWGQRSGRHAPPTQWWGARGSVRWGCGGLVPGLALQAVLRGGVEPPRLRPPGILALRGGPCHRPAWREEWAPVRPGLLQGNQRPGINCGPAALFRVSRTWS